MVSARMRPRFRETIPCHPDQAMEKFRMRLAQTNCPYVGAALSRHVTLSIRKSEQHYWSPVLNIDAEAHEQGTLLRGHFGPNPNVWTMFLAMYAAVIFSTIFTAMYACSQLMIGETPWAFWSLPIAAVLVGIIYSIALMGQGLAQEQMHELRAFFDCAVCHQDLEQIEGNAFSCDAHIDHSSEGCAPASCKTCPSTCEETASVNESEVTPISS